MGGDVREAGSTSDVGSRENKNPWADAFIGGSGCEGISLVCLNVAQSQGKVGGNFMAVAPLLHWCT